jgi:hypothetical protein
MFKKLCILLIFSKLNEIKHLIDKYRMHNLYAIFAKLLNICKQIAGNLVNESGNVPRRGVVPKFSDLEVVALNMASEAVGIDSESLLFANLQEYRVEIPNLISRRQYNDRRKITSSLCNAIRERMVAKMDGGEDYFCIDSKPIEVCRIARSKSEIKDRKLADMTKRTVLSVLQGTYDKDKFVSQLKEKGIDTVLRYTEEGRIYGATFIDHRTGCVLNGSRMGKELSANALQEHFTLPYAGQPPIPLSIPVDAADKAHGQTAYDSEDISGGMGLLTPEGPAVDAEEEAFIRAMKRKKKKKRKGLGM